MTVTPLPTDHFVVIVKRHNGAIYVTIPFSPVDANFVPFYENGVTVFRRSEWNEIIKVVFDFPVDDTLRGKVLRDIRRKFYPTAEFVEHVP